MYLIHEWTSWLKNMNWIAMAKKSCELWHIINNFNPIKLLQLLHNIILMMQSYEYKHYKVWKEGTNSQWNLLQIFAELFSSSLSFFGKQPSKTRFLQTISRGPWSIYDISYSGKFKTLQKRKPEMVKEFLWFFLNIDFWYLSKT